MSCKNCKKNSLKRVVKIGKQPLSGFFYSRKEINLPKELGGREGVEPVRYGDWEKKGIAIDF